MWNSDEICELFLSAHQFAHHGFVDQRISGIRRSIGSRLLPDSTGEVKDPIVSPAPKVSHIEWSETAKVLAALAALPLGIPWPPTTTCSRAKAAHEATRTGTADHHVSSHLQLICRHVYSCIGVSFDYNIFTPMISTRPQVQNN